MKMRKRLYSIALSSTTLILFLILISSSASMASAQSASPTITETSMITNRLVDNTIASKENSITGVSEENSANEESVDITTGSVAAIYGDRIVWTDNRNGNSDIYMN